MAEELAPEGSVVAPPATTDAPEATGDQTIPFMAPPAAPASSNAWMVTEGVAGEGDAPDWYDSSKYESVYAQAAAYPEAARRIGEMSAKVGGFSGAPEGGYAIEMPEGYKGAELTMDDPILKAFGEKAAFYNMSQEAFNGITGTFLSEMQQAEETRLAAEIAAIGPDSTQRIEKVQQWVEANISEEARAGLEAATTSAVGFAFIEELIAKTRSPALDPGEAPTKEDGKKQLKARIAEITNMVDDRGRKRIEYDVELQKERSGLYAKLNPGPHTETRG